MACPAENSRDCAATRSGSTPENKKYGATTMRRAPSLRARSRAAGTDGSASEMNEYSTAA